MTKPELPERPAQKAAEIAPAPRPDFGRAEANLERTPPQTTSLPANPPTVLTQPSTPKPMIQELETIPPPRIAKNELHDFLALTVEVKESEAIPPDLPQRLYIEYLHELWHNPLPSNWQNTTPEDKEKLASRFFTLGKHVLLHSLIWNAIPELQCDKRQAGHLAEKLFHHSQELCPAEEKASWLKVARLVQSEVTTD